jgi:hypothetical protein
MYSQIPQHQTHDQIRGKIAVRCTDVNRGICRLTDLRELRLGSLICIFIIRRELLVTWETGGFEPETFCLLLSVWTRNLMPVVIYLNQEPSVHCHQSEPEIFCTVINLNQKPSAHCHQSEPGTFCPLSPVLTRNLLPTVINLNQKPFVHCHQSEPGTFCRCHQSDPETFFP